MSDDYKEPSWLEYKIMHVLRENAMGLAELTCEIYGVGAPYLFDDEIIALGLARDSLMKRGWIEHRVSHDLYWVKKEHRSASNQ